MFARSMVAAAWTAAAILSVPPAAAAPRGNPQGRQQQRQAPQPTAAGTAAITVTVATEEGAGVKGAQLLATLASPASPQAAGAPGMASVTPMVPAVRDGGRGTAPQKQARTGLGGVATFAELPAGTYVIGVDLPAGFVTRAAPERVEVAEGAQAAVTIKVVRGGVVTGRVLDEDGDPVIGATVSAFRLSRLGGRAATSNYGTQPTNDLGGYRIWGLAAGDYVISAHFDGRETPSGGGGVTADGYLATYFPGVVAFDASRPVQARAGQETGGVDIQLTRGKLGAVSGRVVDAAGGTSGAGGSAQIFPRTTNPTFSMRGSSIRPDGTFLIPNVPAGDYYVYAATSPGRAQNAVREAGYAPVTVNGEEVPVVIQTNVGATVSGRVVLEGTPPAQAGAPGSTGRQGQIRVTARPASDVARTFPTGDQSSATVRPDGSFTLTGLRGPTQFSATSGRAALKEVRRGASDISGHPLELLGTERVDDLVIVMTYDTGGIQGSVEDDSDQPMPDAVTLVFPDDPDKWNAVSPFIRTARVAAAARDGASLAGATPGVVATTAASSVAGAAGFQVAMLPPGRYVVATFADGGVPSAPDRATLERLRELGSAVTVEAGQTATVKVKAIR
jgi:hypothetical protein